MCYKIKIFLSFTFCLCSRPKFLKYHTSIKITFLHLNSGRNVVSIYDTKKKVKENSLSLITTPSSHLRSNKCYALKKECLPNSWNSGEARKNPLKGWSGWKTVLRRFFIPVIFFGLLVNLLRLKRQETCQSEELYNTTTKKIIIEEQKVLN